MCLNRFMTMLTMIVRHEVGSGEFAPYRACQATSVIGSTAKADFGSHLNYRILELLVTGDVMIEYSFGFTKLHFNFHAAQVE